MPSPVGEAASRYGEGPSPYGDGASRDGETPSPYGDAASSSGEAASPIGETASRYQEAASPIKEAASPVQENRRTTPENRPAAHQNLFALVTKLRLITQELTKLRFVDESYGGVVLNVRVTKRSFADWGVTKRSLVTSGNVSRLDVYAQL